MKVPYVSIDNAIQDWTQDTGMGHEEIPHNIIKKWATDCIRWINSEEQLRHRIGILQIKNSRAELPGDFKMLTQAAAKPRSSDPCNCDKTVDPDCCNKVETYQGSRTPKTRREDIVQWVQGTYEKDCNLEINLVCPTCHKTSCDCDTPLIEVDVDRVWEMAHPEIYYQSMTKIGRFGYGPGPWSSYYSPEFKLMRYASNDMFNLQHFLTNCPNVDCSSCVHEFMLDLPFIEVDFQEGEVLISYLGKVLDENGDYMIPDHPDVFDAIFWHLEHKWFYREYRKTGDQTHFQKSNFAQSQRETAIGRANAALVLPDFAQLKNWLENSYYKRVNNFHHHENLNKLTPDEYSKYGYELRGNVDQAYNRRVKRR